MFDVRKPSFDEVRDSIRFQFNLGQRVTRCLRVPDSSVGGIGGDSDDIHIDDFLDW
jgi:hypothetical protein